MISQTLLTWALLGFSLIQLRAITEEQQPPTQILLPKTAAPWMLVRWDSQSESSWQTTSIVKGKPNIGKPPNNLTRKQNPSQAQILWLGHSKRFQTDHIILEQFSPSVALPSLLEVCRKSHNKYKTLARKQNIVQLST